MSLLPDNEPKVLKDLDDALGSRIDTLQNVKLSSLAKDCDTKYLNVLAKTYDVEISGLDEDEARALLEVAFFLKQYAGTPGALKKALEAVYSDVSIDDSIGGYMFDVSVELKGGVSAQKLERIKTIVNKYKNLRSELRNFVMNFPAIGSEVCVVPSSVFSLSYGQDLDISKGIDSGAQLSVNAVYRLQFSI
jgi:P2-related tail formation protein